SVLARKALTRENGYLKRVIDTLISTFIHNIIMAELFCRHITIEGAKRLAQRKDGRESYRILFEGIPAKSKRDNRIGIWNKVENIAIRLFHNAACYV
ncbi:MAG: hypothetical protein NTY68_00825, partial [Candidatus Micrarchaeota archaeon]|nr:hypothetical protein [Candidatus Micrarchaeota archaeon]